VQPKAAPGRGGEKETKPEAFGRWMKKKHPNGAQPGTADKTLAAECSNDIGVDITPRDVRRWRNGK
jgi:hypothetical protein